MKKKYLAAAILAAATLTAGTVGLTACNTIPDASEKDNDEIYAVYQTYVANAESNSQTPLSYEEWLASVRGEKGDAGATGPKGEKGDTGATGPQGEKGDAGVSVRGVTSSVDKWGIAVTLTVHLSDGTTSETSYQTVDPMRTYIIDSLEERSVLNGFGVKDDKITGNPDSVFEAKSLNDVKFLAARGVPYENIHCTLTKGTGSTVAYTNNIRTYLNQGSAVTLADGLNEAKSSAFITMNAANKASAVNLNGQDFINTYAGTRTSGVIFVGNGATLTINGEGSTVKGGTGVSPAVYAYGGGTAIINGGTYIADGLEGQSNSCVLADGGNVVINDGYFECLQQYDGRNWVLNYQDNSNSTITVNGGTFVNFNPAKTGTEPAGVNDNFLGKNRYVVYKDVTENGLSKRLYTVVSSWDEVIAHIKDGYTWFKDSNCPDGVNIVYKVNGQGIKEYEKESGDYYFSADLNNGYYWYEVEGYTLVYKDETKTDGTTKRSWKTVKNADLGAALTEGWTQYKEESTEAVG